MEAHKANPAARVVKEGMVAVLACNLCQPRRLYEWVDIRSKVLLVAQEAMLYREPTVTELEEASIFALAFL